jgi:hypothetical protein
MVQRAAQDLFGVQLSDFHASVIANKIGGVLGDMMGDIFGGGGSKSLRSGGEWGASVDELDGRRGLLLEVPFLVPVWIDDGCINLDLSDFDFGEEFNDALEDLNNGSVPIKIITKDGEGEEVFLDPETIEFGGDQNVRNNRGSGRSSGRRPGGRGRSCSSRRGG